MDHSRVENWGPYMAGLAVVLAFILFGLAGIYTFRQQQNVDHRLCTQTVDNREAVRSTWDAARGLILRNQQTVEQRSQTNQFFDEILKTIPALRCVNNKPVEVK